MKDIVISAKLISWNSLRLTIFYDGQIGNLKPNLVEDDTGRRIPLFPVKASSTASLSVYEFRMEESLNLGHPLFLEIESLGRVALDVNEAASFENFDHIYHYEGKLGAEYQKDKTRFALFAPLACSVILMIAKPDQVRPDTFPMDRIKGGAYETVLEGDYEGARYWYLVNNSGSVARCLDPYAVSSSANGGASYVIDPNKVKTKKVKATLPIMQSYNDAIIYEGSVRDMTIHPGTDIVHKGKFLGLTETGRKTRKGLPAGLDYLSSLGITHFQVLPMYDFATVDEKNPTKAYNWGYDPAQYFVPDGSFVTDPDDPYARLKECQAMVDAFHERGIRVVMDVVYNHVYSWESSNFEKVVPGYYFRHRHNGRMASTSGCGNDLASERPMVRRLIVESALHWVDYYDVDGFRFDLMGIIDVETLKEIRTEALKRKKDFMVYGEGWNMGGEVDFPLGTMGNHALLPGYAFFNDRFREAVKGMLFGDESKKPLLMNCLAGSCVEFNAYPMFGDATQSLNYVECHDNGTFYDYLCRLRPNLREEERLSLCRLALSIVLFSFGVPFIHAGQEIGGTKKGIENSYRSPDEINWFDYALLDEREEMYRYAVKAIATRKKKRFFHHYDPRCIYNLVDIFDYHGAVILRDNDPNSVAPDKKIELCFNVEPLPVTLKLEKGAALELVSSPTGEEGKSKEEVTVPAFSLTYVVYR